VRLARSSTRWRSGGCPSASRTGAFVRNRDEERTRLSGELSRVQARLNSYKARLLIEDPYIGKLYAELVRQTRLHAGAHIKSAWGNELVTIDEDVHAPTYDFTALDQYDNAYLRAVADHVSSLPTSIAHRGREQQTGSERRSTTP
jgi:hypothetical protein